MKNALLFISLIISAGAFAQEDDSVVLAHFFGTALSKDKAYKDLHDLCKLCGHRLSGSSGANKAISLVEKILKAEGLDSIWLQEVMVPHWVRGKKEDADIIYPPEPVKIGYTPVAVCALGGSIATKPGGIEARVVEVKGLGQLGKLNPADIKGKIVFYNEAFDQSLRETFEAYSKAGVQRRSGAAEAARYGAAGVIVRSLAQHADVWPHTGAMAYADSVPKIPAIAISTLDADQLSKALREDPKTTFRFETFCYTLPDTLSYNVIGEIKGTERPNEIIVVGGHLDSWDLAEGAQDDGAGIVQSIEVLRLFKTLGIHPRHTIRFVAYMNEENGTRGGRKYAEWAKTNGEKHIAAIESDAGGFTPRGFSLEGSDTLRALVKKKWKTLMEKFEIGSLDDIGSGADVGYLQGNAQLLAELHPDSQRYFDFHHNARDTWENVNDRELEMGAAAMASFVYLIDKYGLDGD